MFFSVGEVGVLGFCGLGFVCFVWDGSLSFFWGFFWV